MQFFTMVTNRKTYKAITILWLFSSLVCYGQGSLVSVSPLTGTANVGIPISSVRSGSLMAPVTLAYNNSGVKVKDVEGNAGIGWNVIAGGQISRQLRGLPDDVQHDVQNHTRTGWLYSDNSNVGFAIQNNGSSCSESPDIGYMSNHFPETIDTEPDVFSIQAPGLSVEFVFDEAHNIRTIPYQDLKITYITAGDGEITSFKVTNDQGVVYTFSIPEFVTRTTYSSNENNIKYFKKEYNQYTDGIAYTGGWYLYSMTDQYSNKITFNYTDSYAQSNKPINLYTTSLVSGVKTQKKEPQYGIEEDHVTKVLASIIGSSGFCAFNYQINPSTDKSLIRTVITNNLTYVLNYSPINSQDAVYYKRCFLTDVSTKDCNTPVRYHFTYNLPESLPDSLSKQIDYWGYYNSNVQASTLLPSLKVNPSNSQYPRYQILTDNYSRPDYTAALAGGDNRAANLGATLMGSLFKIEYGDNAATAIEYESNSYYDVPAAHTVNGGGIRVKSITNYDGINALNQNVTNYSYDDPATSQSSGRPISLPMFAFTTPYNGSGSANDVWDLSTVISEEDLSTEDHSIVYKYFKKSQAHAGSTMVENIIPATYWDNFSTPADNTITTADWTPTVNFAGKTNCSSPIGNVFNDRYTYPFTPNPNYDGERGLPNKITNYDDLGHEVSETSYTYKRTKLPLAITGLRIEDNSNARMYAQYKIFASQSEALVKTDEKVFDSATFTQSRSSSTTYRFESTAHNLMTSKETTNSDRAIKRTLYKYVKDYTLVANPGDLAENALYNLNLLNINVPVETYFQDVRGGGVKTIGANLLQFNLFTQPVSDATGNITFTHNYNVAKRFTFLTPNGVTDFAISNVSSAGVFSKDSRYLCMENETYYDQNGSIQTNDDNYTHVKTTLRDIYTQLPVCVVSNAATSEIGYFNIANTVNGANFTQDANTFSTQSFASRTGQTQDYTPDATYSKTIHKAANAKNYIFSAWINTALADGSLTVQLMDNNSQTTSYTINVPMSPSWTYKEIKVPVTAMTSDFTVKFYRNEGLHHLQSSMVTDEVLFYPENAEVNAFVYDNTTLFKLSETNTNGITAYYSYDEHGRLKYAYDKDKNIIMRKSYVTMENYNVAPPIPGFTIGPNKYVKPGDPVTFALMTDFGTCILNGLTIHWDFGDGATLNATASSPITHTYSTAGDFIVNTSVTLPSGQIVRAGGNVHIGAAPVFLTYTNNTTGQATFKFYQNSTLLYTYSSADLSSGTVSIPKGIYDVVVEIAVDVTNPLQTYRLQTNMNKSLLACSNYSISTNTPTLSFNWDLSMANTVDFVFDPFACN